MLLAHCVATLGIAASGCYDSHFGEHRYVAPASDLDAGSHVDHTGDPDAGRVLDSGSPKPPLMAADASSPQLPVLLDAGPLDGSFDAGPLAPDDSPFIAFAADLDEASVNGLWAAQLSDPSHLRRISAPVETTDTQLRSLAYTRDGRAIVSEAMIASNHGYQLFITDRDQYQPREVLKTHDFISAFTIAPDGKHIAVRTAEHCYVASLDAGIPGAARALDTTSWLPTFTPDGRSIYYEHDESMQLLELDSTSAPLTIGVAQTIMFSGDGNHVAYTVRDSADELEAFVFDRRAPKLRHRIAQATVGLSGLISISNTRVHLQSGSPSAVHWLSSDLDGNAQSVPDASLFPMLACGSRMLLWNESGWLVSDEQAGVSSLPIPDTDEPRFNDDCTQVISRSMGQLTITSLGPLSAFALGATHVVNVDDADDDHFVLSPSADYVALFTSSQQRVRIVHVASNQVVFDIEHSDGTAQFSLDDSQLLFLQHAGVDSSHRDWRCELRKVALAGALPVSSQKLDDRLLRCGSPIAVAPDSQAVSYETVPTRGQSESAGVFERRLDVDSVHELLPKSHALRGGVLQMMRVPDRRALLYTETDRYLDPRVSVVDLAAHAAPVFQVGAEDVGVIENVSISSTSDALAFSTFDAVWLDHVRWDAAAPLTRVGPITSQLQYLVGRGGLDDFVGDLVSLDGMTFVPRHITRTGELPLSGTLADPPTDYVSLPGGRTLLLSHPVDAADGAGRFHDGLYLASPAPSSDSPRLLSAPDDIVTAIVAHGQDNVWFMTEGGALHGAQLTGDARPRTLDASFTSSLQANLRSSELSALVYAGAAGTVKILAPDDDAPRSVQTKQSSADTDASSDGKHVIYVFVRQDASGLRYSDVRVLDLQSGNDTLLTTNLAPVFRPTASATWASDGRHAVVALTTSFIDDNQYLVSFTTPTPTTYQLPALQTTLFDDSGHYLAYQRADDATAQIFVMDLEHSAQPIAIGPALPAGRRAWLGVWIE